MVNISFQILPVLIVRYCSAIKKQNPDFHIAPQIPIVFADKKKRFKIASDLSRRVIATINQDIEPIIKKQ